MSSTPRRQPNPRHPSNIDATKEQQHNHSPTTSSSNALGLDHMDKWDSPVADANEGLLPPMTYISRSPSEPMHPSFSPTIPPPSPMEDTDENEYFPSLHPSMLSQGQNSSTHSNLGSSLRVPFQRYSVESTQRPQLSPLNTLVGVSSSSHHTDYPSIAYNRSPQREFSEGLSPFMPDSYLNGNNHSDYFVNQVVDLDGLSFNIGVEHSPHSHNSSNSNLSVHSNGAVVPGLLSPTNMSFISTPSSTTTPSPYGQHVPLTPSAHHIGHSPIINTSPMSMRGHLSPHLFSMPSKPAYSSDWMGTAASRPISHNQAQTGSGPGPNPFSQQHHPTNDGLGPFVPQKLYRPHTSSDVRRYVEEVNLEGPISFMLKDPHLDGIPLRDALTSRFMRLDGRDDLMFVNRGPSISIRLQWQGYQPWSRQIPTRDFRSPPGPITRSKLAKNVAKSVERFLVEYAPRPMDMDADPYWRVGTNYITLDDLILVSLHHVSMGSWQANLRLRERPVWWDA